MDLPIEGSVSSGYGLRKDPISGIEKFHYGVDISAPRGTDLLANVQGVIKFAGQKGNYGNLVILETGGVEQYFGHLDSLNVKTGQRVEKGYLLGEIGSTGYSTGNHLHWELKKYGVNQNPLDFKIGIWDSLQEGWESIFRIPGSENDLFSSDIKQNVNEVIINVILILALIVFIIFAFYPNSKTLVKEVMKK